MLPTDSYEGVQGRAKMVFWSKVYYTWYVVNGATIRTKTFRFWVNILPLPPKLSTMTEGVHTFTEMN